MSGHSKWANIQNKKNKTDAARGKIFTKIGREIAIAVKEGGGDPANNSKLRDVIAKAKANNMPNDNINRSIKKAMGESGNVNYEEITYEGYGPGGTAVIVEVVTDNRNRTAAEIRHIFDKSGGSMGATGCVAWMFDKKGVLVIERSASIDEDELMMAALEAGAEDPLVSLADNVHVRGKVVAHPHEGGEQLAALAPHGEILLVLLHGGGQHLFGDLEVPLAEGSRKGDGVLHE